ncbi:AraC family transcriptional regulator [Rubellicoccus peritrichatus]|uniref:AraC family transcriptional regulator n=1 Tax=Rubellicoccus peritrichatus TaxID=3080537 RepID=A0AAQ3QRT4_9BACT|nr:AraC family transcriptional regulator [Puniceicoccus sp. CR14]WOO39601.1 AraC family transcriptional regulator [Puniceicoccus sp. CR14]
MSSNGIRFVGDHIEPFFPGDFAILGGNLPHLYMNSMPPAPKSDWAQSRVIQFRRDCFGEGFFDVPEMKDVAQLFRRAGRGLKFTGDSAAAAIKVMERLFKTNRASRISCFIELLELMADAPDVESLASPNYAPSLSSWNGERLDQVCNLVRERFAEPLSQAEVAKAVNMSPPAFSRYFGKRTGRTFVSFLNEVRIGHACRQLQESDKTILEICYESGFSNLSNFNRRFRDIRSMTPSEYRKCFAEYS